MIDATKMVKKVQEMRDDGYLSDAILREMVKQIRATDSDFNFVGVYLYNTESSTGADSTVAAEVPLLGNRLYRFRLNPERTKFVFNDARLRDKVADNTATDDLTESDELVFGTGFGIVTDIQTGPDGNMYLVSPSDGSIRKITRP